MKKFKKNKFIAIMMAVTMVGSMFTGIGVKQVSAATYKSGTIDPTNLKVGDIIYKGVKLSIDYQAVVCNECKKVWITNGTSYGIGDMKNSKVKETAPHSSHTSKVGYSEFNWFFYDDGGSTLNFVKSDTPYTIVENDNLVCKITYNTDGGTAVNSTTANKLPDELPTTTKEGYDFVGWYTNEGLTTEATPGASISADTTLYAKWKVHEHTYSKDWYYDSEYHYHVATCSHTSEVADKAAHTYGTTGSDRYTCGVCGYVDRDKKDGIEAIELTKKYISEIGKVEYTTECRYKIEEARYSYDELTDEQKKEITPEELRILTDAESAYAKLYEEHSAAEAVVAKINAIGDVYYTEESKGKIDAARKAYDTLTSTQKELISEAQYKVLTDAESRYAKLKADDDAANVVIAKINAIGTVEYTEECKQKIDAARDAYNSLTTDQKSIMGKYGNYNVLVAAEETYAKLKVDNEVAKVAITKINAIGTVEYTEESKAKIDTAREAYNALTTDQKELIDANQVKILTDAEETYAKLKEDHEIAKEVLDVINAIGDVEYTEESKAKIDTAREAYNALTTDQKALITEEQYKVLTDAESRYAKLKADDEAAKAVVTIINAIGDVEYTEESKAKIDTAREAYNALTTDQKALITEEQYKVLTDAEGVYGKLKADDEVAKVVEKINAIGKVEYTEDCKTKIDTARKAYDSLTADQKAAITDEQYKVLVGDENSYTKLKTDNEAAKAVVEKINAIGVVGYTTDIKGKIDAARKAYDDLTADQKKIITEAQYKLLTDAEGLYAQLEETSEYAANSLTLNSKFAIKIGKSIKVKWGKVDGADGYDVYMSYCGKGKGKVVKSTKALSTTIKKLNKKAVNQKNSVKCYVIAYKIVDGEKQEIGKTNIFHAVGNKNKSLTEPKNIKLNKKSYELAVGKTATIKASIVKKNNKLKVITHTEEFRYATSDTGVVTVSKDGKITAQAVGTCDVYVYAVNGCAKKITVTVK